MSEDVKQPNYWKSLNELAQNQEYKKFLHREFPEDATELSDKVSRRSFLRVMGASIALAGFAACKRPVQKILPYTKQPEDMVQGEPMYYATAMPFQDALTGLVAETHEGRPTKLEGNKQHQASQGNTNTFQQAAILGLYDPDRSRYIRKDGNRSSLNDFVNFCSNHFSQTDRDIVFIAEANSSPTYQRLKEQALKKFPNARWVTYEPFGEDRELEGHRMAFGQPLRKALKLNNAKVVVSLDDDFMNPAANKNNVQYIKQMSEARRVRSTEDEMSRLYAVENTFTLTGSNADNRLRLKASDIEAFTYALAAELSKSVSGLEAFAGYSNPFSDKQADWIKELAADLVENPGESVLTAGRERKPAVHAAVAAVNKALGNIDQTVSYYEVPFIDEPSGTEALAEAVQAMNNNEVDTAVLIGGNPAFNAPDDLNFESALNKVDTKIQLSDYYDETAKLVNWHVNRAHFLESWSDGYSHTGTRSVVQPMIRPLYSGVSNIEFLAAVTNGTKADSHKLVQQTWKSYYPNGFKNKWERILHDGVDTDNNFSAVNPSLSNGFASNIQTYLNQAKVNNGIELVLRADNTVFDGRFANNGWLQELPDPMTKVTWDNVALMSPKTAKKIGVESEQIVKVTAGGRTVEIAAWIQPGHADDSITISVGQGRSQAGRVANNVGVNTYPLRTTENLYYHTDVSIENTGRHYEIACTQDHHSMEGRSLIREATLEEYREEPDYATYEGAYEGREIPGKEFAKEKGMAYPLPLFDAADYPDYEPQWGMNIDLNACIGCGTCTIACQAENNIPVIGKREVRKGREMHWIRTDRYFEGDDEENPKAVHQPVPCMHCELAPCEEVCPVAATTHSDDGMNQMTYNRCIGTRYCLNNCPYKVRRFNFFNYSKEYLTSGSDPEIVQMAMNPDVTVRFRGVMEKCTYCVQRVNRAKIKTKIKTNGSVKPPDGMVETACQQACPADAITFGDLTDDQSVVSQTKRNERDYDLLEELNTRPRTSYLANLRNPNPKLA